MSRITNFLTNIKNKIFEAPSKVSQIARTVIRRVGYAIGGSDTSGVRGREFEDSPYDFQQIIRGYNTDSYIRQGFDKYVELMFKAGWGLHGKNESAIEYLRHRLKYIAESTMTPTSELLIEIAEDLVKFSNVFIIKARARQGEVPGASSLRIQGVDGRQPVSGYFTLPVGSIGIARDLHGNVLEYEQDVPGVSEPLTIRKEDIVHIHYKRERGYAFGSPFILPVLDDVRLFRDIEEKVATMIHRNIHPLLFATVGLPDRGMEGTQEEIDEYRREIEEMPLDGVIVGSERHKIEAIGTEGKALNAENYLRHYEQRVITGIGLPETMFGKGDTANRGTADNLSAEARDRIKAFQQIEEIFINNFIINELLLEGGFDPVNNPYDVVEFKFNEIDIDNKIKTENHIIQLWLNDLITHDEARLRMGEDPITDLSQMHSILFQPSDTSKGIDNKERPENQHGKKTGPKKSSGNKNPTVDKSKETIDIKENREVLHIDKYLEKLNYHYMLTKLDTIDMVRQHYLENEDKTELSEFNKKELELITYLTKNSILSIVGKYARVAVYEGLEKCKADCGVSRTPNINIEDMIAIARSSCDRDVNRLMDDLTELVVSIIKTSNKENVIPKVLGAFNAMEFRLKFMAQSQLMKAYNYSYAISALKLGREEAEMVVSDNGCSRCKDKANEKLLLDNNLYNSVPPWHSNCLCHLRVE